MEPQQVAHWVRQRNLLAGIVLSLAILDHTRLFFHYWNTPPADLLHPDLVLFFTRFSAHFFAPAVFLLTGITLYQQGHHRTKKRNARIWIRNGLGLIVLEIGINNFLYTFDPYYRTLGLLIIGMMGISLLLLSVAQYLPRFLLTGLVLLVLAGHNMLDGTQEKGTSALSVWWYILHQQKYILQGRQLFTINYTILPWFFLLLAGYLAAPYALLAKTTSQKKPVRIIGILLCLLFVILRSSNSYGDPQPWQQQATISGTIISFFNITKYPASLDYFCITIGPLFLLYGSMGKQENRITRFFSVLGKMPLTVYLLSTLLIHAAAMIVIQTSGSSWKHMIITPASYEADSLLKGYGFPLITVYILWLFFMLLLYRLLLWLQQLRQRSYRPAKTAGMPPEAISGTQELFSG